MREVTYPLAGERIVELRKGRHMTGVALSRALGVSSSMLCSVERGRSNPSFYLLLKAARYFGVPLSFLAGENIEGVAS